MNHTLAAIDPFYAACLDLPASAGDDGPRPSHRAVYARLPRAPITGSPVPHLTSLYHFDRTGEYGDRRWPGNCGGLLIRDLLNFFRPDGLVFDPMTGSGTARDVCEELGLPCLAWDIHQDFDACDPRAFPPPETFAFIWAHPPYWRQKLYADDPRDLSRSGTLDDFLRRYGQFIRNCKTSLKPGGRLAILMGDYTDREAGFVPLVWHTKRLAFAAGLVQRCTDIIRFSHGASSGRKVYRSSFIPGLQRPATEPISIVILASSGRPSDRRSVGPRVVGRVVPWPAAITSRSRIMRRRHDGSVPPRAGRHPPAIEPSIRSGRPSPRISARSSSAPSAGWSSGGCPRFARARRCAMSNLEPAPRSYPAQSIKITDGHRARLAVVYVRQSTPQQVAENRESLARQYALADHARGLGWPAERVLVIDDDLGQSGRTADGRLGFQRLLGEVTMDHVGLVLGLEMSRLARSCKDWHHLLEVCGIFGALLADQDGVYDPSDPNDRMVLGLKGQLSEMELHIIRSRLDRGRLNKARRGELFLHAPIGYVKTPAGGLALDPDEQVRDVVRLIFDKFAELGTAHALVRYLRRNQVRLGVRPHDGPNRGELEWRPVRLSTIYRILRHPVYAGTYAFGRAPVDPRRHRRDGRPCVKHLPMSDWAVTLHDHLPAYITREQYLRNAELLRQNRSTASTRGHARGGVALLGGLIFCGHCGGRKHVQYSSAGRPRYECVGHLGRGEPRTCPGVSAAVVDEVVAEEVLRALTPAGIELSLTAAEDIERERGRLDAHWRAEQERAGYEARLAERSYRAVDPENRLVARTLERRWEEALRREQEVREGYDRFRRELPRRLTPGELDRIRALATDIPSLWHAADTPAADRKEIARALIERVRVTPSGDTERVAVRIEWIGGTSSEHVVRRSVRRYEQMSVFPEMRALVEACRATGATTAEVADRLNGAGFRPASTRSERFTPRLAGELVYRLGLSPTRRPTERLSADEWWISDLASELGMRLTRLRHWVKQGYVHTRKVGGKGCLVVWADEGECARLRRLRDHPRQDRSNHYPPELIRPKDRPGRGRGRRGGHAS